MGTKRIILIVAMFVLGCGKSGKKEQSPECKQATNSAYQLWSAYIKAIDREQPHVEKRAAKYAPEGYPELKKEAEVAIQEWKTASAAAKEQALQARFGKGGDESTTPGEVALDMAQTARDKAKAAIDRSFAARLKEGADAIQRRKDALDPEDGKKLSAKRRVELEEKLVATQERVTKNNHLVQSAKDRLLGKSDAILELAKKALAADEKVAATCAQ